MIPEPSDKLPDAVPSSTPGEPRRVAVVDIGSTSIRMSLAEISPDGRVRTVESLYQAVNLGKDTFTTSSIKTETIEDCVRVLKGYGRILAQYKIVQPDQIRVVATSAVHEALNQSHFIDRVYIATGLQVEPLDEAEANRFAYLAVQPLLQREAVLRESTFFMLEVGGGNTEILLLDKGDVAYARTYRLGSLRLRLTLETHRAPRGRVRSIMETQVHKAVEQVRHEVAGYKPAHMVTLGGDMRFAASQLLPDWHPDRLAKVPVSGLATLTERVLSLSADQLVRKHHLSFPDAETLGPALLAYLLIARGFQLEHVLVTSVNFRDGLLTEMGFQGRWTEEFSSQIIRSALHLGRKYGFDEAHALHTAKLSRFLFHALREEHHLDLRYDLLLYVAALLHDIGNFVSNRSHHKHSMYLIQNGELFGLSHRDTLLVALVARYHRRASPKPIHEGYMLLDREGRINVAKMAALLRVADALDRSNRQRIDEIQCTREKDHFRISVPRVEDLSFEELALQQKGSLFEEVFGMPVLLQKAHPADS